MNFSRLFVILKCLRKLGWSEKMTIQEQILNAIQDFDTIIIHRHKRPDPDAVGSQMGLADILKTSFPAKKIYAVGKQYSSFDWLGVTDEIEDSAYQNALVIVVDTANQPRVDDDRYLNGKMLIKIDHHPNDDQFGDLMWVDETASSTSELIGEFCFQLKDQLMMTSNAARLLYAGIVGDTGRFKYPATTPKTFAVTSKLTEYDFDASAINQMEDEINLPLAHLAAYTYDNLVIHENGAAHLVLSNAVLEPFNLGDESTSSIVPLPGNLKEVTSWAILVEQKDGGYRIRLRSKGPAINELAKQYGGGGHPLASGAVLENDDEIEEFLTNLDKVVDDYHATIQQEII